MRVELLHDPIHRCKHAEPRALSCDVPRCTRMARILLEDRTAILALALAVFGYSLVRQHHTRDFHVHFRPHFVSLFLAQGRLSS